jgi:hypothetical protein
MADDIFDAKDLPASSSPDRFQIRLNGNPLGFLAVTPNNGTGASQISILASQQLAGTNTIEFIVANPAWAWGLSNLLLAPIV